jgi:hypothetical protein
LNVSQGRCGQAIGVAGLQERVDDDGAGDRGVRAAGQQVAGEVTEPVDDLRAGAAAERPVGEVGLPALIGHVRLEPEAGGAGPLAWLGSDQAGGVQDPADGRGRRDVQPGLFQAPGDRDRAGVPAGRGQLQTGLEDEVADFVPGRARIAPGLRERASTASGPPAL